MPYFHLNTESPPKLVMKPFASSTVDVKVNFSRHTTATSSYSPKVTAAVVDTRRRRILRSPFLPTGTFASVSPIICILIFASLLGSVSTSVSACHLGQCVTKCPDIFCSGLLRSESTSASALHLGQCVGKFRLLHLC